jgi:hypothetical protein
MDIRNIKYHEEKVKFSPCGRALIGGQGAFGRKRGRVHAISKEGSPWHAPKQGRVLVPSVKTRCEIHKGNEGSYCHALTFGIAALQISSLSKQIFLHKFPIKILNFPKRNFKEIQDNPFTPLTLMQGLQSCCPTVFYH